MRILVLILVTSLVLQGQSKWQHGRIVVANDNHHLQYEDGTSFFWLGDTAWELFHRLNKEEIKFYLDNRKAKGFTLIQAVVLAEFNGLRKANQEGQLPLINNDPLKPNEKYFDLVDFTVNQAMERGLVMGLLPTWGDKVNKMWGDGPVIFNESNALSYGKYLGARYKKFPNIIWILGGDRPAMLDSTDFRPIWRAMAKGIESTYGKNALISYHPNGGPDNRTSNFIHQESWLDINMMQSGHGSGHDVNVWEWIESDYKLSPAKPTLDAEPNYEDHPVNPWPKYDPVNGYFNDYDVRKQCYRSVFAGACGVTYGHHSMWQFWSPREEKVNNASMYWTAAVDRPGAFQVGYLRWLMESRPFLKSVPAQNLVGVNNENGNHIQSIKGNDGSFAMIYIPVGKTISVNTSQLSGQMLRCWWFNPRTGLARLADVRTKEPKLEFTPPTLGYGDDWVLVIDDIAKNFATPGSR